MTDLSKIEAKHTPGPWSTEGADNCNYMAEPDHASHRIVGDGWTIAMVLCDVGELAAASEPNARLMAAAPDLLAACKAVLDEGETTATAYDKIRAAIAKAEA